MSKATPRIEYRDKADKWVNRRRDVEAASNRHGSQHEADRATCETLRNQGGAS